MNYSGFIGTVKERTQLSDAEAQQVACATLQTLSERLSVGEAEDIAERLPPEFRSCLESPGIDRRFHFDEFLRRISERVGVDEQSAERDARAVFAALWQAVGPDEFADIRAELPKDFGPLLDSAVSEAPVPSSSAVDGPGSLPLEAFLEKVASHANVDQERARRLAEAVLEVLAIRITAGQVEDILPLVAPELRPALERGIDKGGRAAQPLSVDTFVSEVARRAQVSRSEAANGARAVFAALREAIGEKEFQDTTAQLPDEYRLILRPTS
jgi:uncharacterized protein (DUF2267 family)